MSTKTQIHIALFYFLLAGALGVFLRALHVFEFRINYRFIVHSHSHIALLGWIYVALTSLFYYLFIKKNNRTKRNYILGFGFTQFTLLGMLCTFPFQGYGLFSIIFSTLFIFASYWFTWFFSNNVNEKAKASACYPYIKASLFYLVLSSIGPWALGGIMTTLGVTSIWYRLSIYFYLHFQYNAWMIFAILGIFLFIMEHSGISIKNNKSLFIFINLSVILTTLLSALWTKPNNFVYALSATGAGIQLICFCSALLFIKQKRETLQQHFSMVQKLLFKLVIVLLGVKLILQFLGSLPYFAKLSSNIIEFTIAYLHWIFLGVISLSLFFILDYVKHLRLRIKHVYFYLIGFLLTEGLLAYKGIAIWSNNLVVLEYFSVYLLIASLLLFVAIAMIIFNIKITKQ
jgi:hypothetical protein|tara:strand:+ start:6380 stop:7582 length:1203 start_codon:yes stop_codon:yes gene_type:complete